MKIFFHPNHDHHDPPFEGYDKNENKPSFETAERATRVRDTLQQTPWADFHAPTNFGLEPIQAIHSQKYLTYLQEAYNSWQKYSPVSGMAFIPGTYGITYQETQALSGYEQHGFFLLDTTVAITPGTFSTAIWSAYTALSGAQALLFGERSAFSLNRPPGHHAGSEVCGGYCYFNNAAIAGHWLSQNGKVAIVDVDYHAGNGTQEIFYARSDVLTISLHADPAAEYPYYAGFSNETGTGAGEGFHHNFPLPAGTTITEYQKTLEKAIKIVADFSPQFLVISAGMDTYKDEPLGTFKLTTEEIHQIGRGLAAVGLPTLIVMEGGYHLPSLGENFCAFLQPFS